MNAVHVQNDIMISLGWNVKLSVIQYSAKGVGGVIA